MTEELQKFEDLLSRILKFPSGGRRRLIALAGPPGSGKSTLARRLVDSLTASGRPAQVVPMDGFHLDNNILEDIGLLKRKGAPETFDLSGFRCLIARLHEPGDVFFSVFDRRRDMAIAGAGLVSEDCEFVVIEGNYLLLDEPGWNALSSEWDISVWLKVALPELQTRTVRRWLEHGFSEEESRRRVLSNDLPNARRTMAAISPHDIEIQEQNP